MWLLQLVEEASVSAPYVLVRGVQNKILEYMALGLPTVSTSMGLEGLDALNKKEILIADDSTSIADSLVYLLNDRPYARSMAEQARKYVESHHSWNTQLSRILSVIDEKLLAS